MAKIKDGLKYCQFLTITSFGNITTNTIRKYYTQLVHRWHNKHTPSSFGFLDTTIAVC